jgi:hypothetical protein
MKADFHSCRSFDPYCNRGSRAAGSVHLAAWSRCRPLLASPEHRHEAEMAQSRNCCYRAVVPDHSYQCHSSVADRPSMDHSASHSNSSGGSWSSTGGSTAVASMSLTRRSSQVHLMMLSHQLHYYQSPGKALSIFPIHSHAVGLVIRPKTPASPQICLPREGVSAGRQPRVHAVWLLGALSMPPRLLLAAWLWL